MPLYFYWPLIVWAGFLDAARDDLQPARKDEMAA
jgi:hypothetical protein